MLPLLVGRACPSTWRELAGHHTCEPRKRWALALVRGREEARGDTQICSPLLEHQRVVRGMSTLPEIWTAGCGGRTGRQEAGECLLKFVPV